MDEEVTSASRITDVLNAWSRGEPGAAEALMPLIYSELRRRAASHMRGENRNHSLSPTELVHETYLRLCKQNASWERRHQFYAVASKLMRRVLVDHARSRRALKRGRELLVTLEDWHGADVDRSVDVIALEGALEELARLDPRQAQLVELRYFGGLTLEESATVIGVSKATADRDWASAKAWLFGKLKRGGRPEPGNPFG